MPNGHDLTPDELDVLRQIAEPAALLKLSMYFCRPYIRLVRQLLDEGRITREEALEVAKGIGVAFDALAAEIPELQEYRDTLPKE